MCTNRRLVYHRHRTNIWKSNLDIWLFLFLLRNIQKHNFTLSFLFYFCRHDFKSHYFKSNSFMLFPIYFHCRFGEKILELYFLTTNKFHFRFLVVWCCPYHCWRKSMNSVNCNKKLVERWDIFLWIKYKRWLLRKYLLIKQFYKRKFLEFSVIILTLFELCQWDLQRPSQAFRNIFNVIIYLFC